MDLCYQFINYSNAAQAAASAKNVKRPLAHSILMVHSINAAGGEKRHHHGEGEARHLPSEKRRERGSSYRIKTNVGIILEK